jgi:hypothetical protein
MVGMNDTHPQIREMQLEILRNRTPEQRLRSAIEQSVYLINSSRKELEKRMSSVEAKIEWVRINYGNDLAKKYRQALRERGDLT